MLRKKLWISKVRNQSQWRTLTFLGSYYLESFLLHSWLWDRPYCSQDGYLWIWLYIMCRVPVPVDLTALNWSISEAKLHINGAHVRLSVTCNISSCLVLWKETAMTYLLHVFIDLVVRQIFKSEIHNGSLTAVIATSRSVSTLHKTLTSSRGQHFFSTIIELKPPNHVCDISCITATLQLCKICLISGSGDYAAIQA